LRKGYFTEKDFRKGRLVAVSFGIGLHLLLVIGIFLYELQRADANAAAASQNELTFGSSGGGGGEGAEDKVLQFGPQAPSDAEHGKQNDTVYSHHFNLIQIEVYDDRAAPVPVPDKKIETPKPVVKKKQKAVKPIIAENLPTRWIRRGTGPGTGGGAGGGSGGGIGSHQGYSIDWGGTGSRRLLSGRLPTYPDGTDKQMAVVLRFTVLPDGTVDAIIPAKKTDELLEHSAIVALRTWRFDPVPSQMEQKSQIGKVTFNFKLE
jgi:TonB family protein